MHHRTRLSAHRATILILGLALALGIPDFNSRRAAAAEEKAAEAPPPKFGRPSKDEKMRSRIKDAARAVRDRRGLAFSGSIDIRELSPEDFRKYTDHLVHRDWDPEEREYFFQIMRAIGYHRGAIPEGGTDLLLAFVGSVGFLIGYDERSRTIYHMSGAAPTLPAGTTVEDKIESVMLSVLLDQNFDLSRDKKLSLDESTARNAVSAGDMEMDAFRSGYRRGAGRTPTSDEVERVLLKAAAEAPPLNGLVKLSPEMLRKTGMADLADKFHSGTPIPQFILELAVGMNIRAMLFFNEIGRDGADAANDLYGTAAPVSTEQVLHPEKYRSGEKPHKLSFPDDVETDERLAGWENLDSDVLGEFGLRIIFNIFGMQSDASVAAAGWDGDIYLVLKRAETDETALLMRTCWDDEREAAEFAAKYEEVQALKRKDNPGLRTLLIPQGLDVLIIEGGTEEEQEKFKSLLEEVKKTK